MFNKTTCMSYRNRKKQETEHRKKRRNTCTHIQTFDWFDKLLRLVGLGVWKHNDAPTRDLEGEREMEQRRWHTWVLPRRKHGGISLQASLLIQIHLPHVHLHRHTYMHIHTYIHTHRGLGFPGKTPPLVEGEGKVIGVKSSTNSSSIWGDDAVNGIHVRLNECLETGGHQPWLGCLMRPSSYALRQLV